MDPTNPTDQRDLIAQAQQGDPDALLRLCALHKDRIGALARKHSCPGLEEDDVVQTGYTALLEALGRFDPAKGASLWAFAERSVKGAMIRASSKWQGLSDLERKAYKPVKNALDRLRGEASEEPGVEELAQASGETAQTVGRLLALWNGRTQPLEDEFEPREAAHLYAHLPESVKTVLDAEAAAEGGRAVRAALGAGETPGFWVLVILFEAEGYNYGWGEIAAMLEAGPPPQPSWEPTVAAEFGRLNDVPRTWQDASRAFAGLKRPLTAEMLRQRYSRAVKQIQRHRGLAGGGEQ